MKLWDITPRKKRKEKLTLTEKRTRRSNVSWMFFLSILAAFFIIFFGASKLPSSEENPISPTNTPVNTTNTAQSSPTAKTQANISIKLLNGTGRFEETDQIKKALTQSGFKVAATENALNIYEKTIIYYQNPYENYANDIAKVLSSYSPKVQKFTQETKYDIVVVIGGKF